MNKPSTSPWIDESVTCQFTPEQSMALMGEEIAANKLFFFFFPFYWPDNQSRFKQWWGFSYLLLRSFHRLCCWAQRSLWPHWNCIPFQAGDLTAYEAKSYSPELLHFFLESREYRSTLSFWRSTSGWRWSLCAQSQWLLSPLEELVRKEEDSFICNCLRFPRLIFW